MNTKFIYDRILSHNNMVTPFIPYEKFRLEFNRILKGHCTKEIVQWCNSHNNDRYYPDIDTIKFQGMDFLLNTYGIETIDKSETRNGHYIDYLNIGDPYQPTIVHCTQWRYPFRIAYGGWSAYIK